MIFRLPLLSFTIPCSMGLAGTSFASILRDWRQSRASETSGALDTTRYHLSILFVDDDNSRARVAESIFERVSIHADAGFWLYPHSATVTANSSKALRNVPSEAVNVCAALNLCPSRSSAPGAVLCRSDLDAYDLIICLDDNVANLVLKGLLESADEAEFYRPKCRTLSEFLAPDATERGTTEATLDTFMRNRILGLPSHEDLSATLGSDVFLAKPCVEEARLLWNADVTAAVPNRAVGSWPAAEAAHIMAAAGLTHFCKAAIDASFSDAFRALLETAFCRRDDVEISQADAETRIRRNQISGFFSYEERMRRFEEHRLTLKDRFAD